MTRRSRSSTGAAALALAGALTAAPTIAGDADALVIEASGGPVRFQVEIADTPEERARGLMFRDALPPDAGMLFVYPHEQVISMWMRNTLIPLDMLFIGADGRVVNIRERAVPGSTETIPSAGPVRAVLELNGGTVARLKLKPGDRVRHPEIAK